MPALDRAFTLEQMHQITVPVAQDLDFHMPGRCQPALQKQGIVAERRASLTPGAIDGIGQISLHLDDAHAAPAATRGCLDQDRISDLPRSGGHISVRAQLLCRQGWHVCLLHQPFG